MKDRDLAAKVFRSSVDVAGARIHFRHVPADAPLVVLLHGVAAHSGWWNHLLPGLMSSASIAVLDLSGHGNSDHRRQYSAETWSDEVRAVVESTGHRSATLVGHSMGGRVAAVTAGRFPCLVSHVVLLDSHFHPPGSRRTHPHPRPRRFYATREEALARFRLFPPETNAEQGLIADIAEQSIKLSECGWTTKYDPSVFGQMSDSYVAECLRRICCPTTLAWSRRSPFVTQEAVDLVRRFVRGEVTLHLLDDCHHHVILDVPDRCIALIHDAIGEKS